MHRNCGGKEKAESSPNGGRDILLSVLEPGYSRRA